MKKPRLALFGTPHYSLIVFEKLRRAGYPIVCVVTKSPRPIGRKQTMTSAPVAGWASQKHFPLFIPLTNSTKPWLFADEKILTQQVMSLKPDLLITADFTQKIPLQLVQKIKYGGLNVHPSLLPAYRGPAPVPWAILNGEKETGVSIVTLSEQFDSGIIVAQEKELILPTDTTDVLLTRLFEKGAELLLKTIPKYITHPNPLLPREGISGKTITHSPLLNRSEGSYFPRLTRDTGFEPWEKIITALVTGVGAENIERKYRAFTPWPGLWSKVKIRSEEKRLKILKTNLQLTTQNLQLLEVQLEGKNPLTNTKDIMQLLNSIQTGNFSASEKGL